MQYIELKRYLTDFTVFSLAEIRKFDAHFHRRRLNDWQAKGYIRKIIKGYYIFSDTKLNEKVVFEIANRIYSPSYISLEMALSYYGLIPESVYGITSISTRRTYKFKTEVAEFSYRTVKPALFFGYNIVSNNGKSFKIAKPQKAILDYFYINTNIRKFDDFASLRINKKRYFELVDDRALKAFLTKFAQQSLTKRINLFLEYIKNA